MYEKLYRISKKLKNSFSPNPGGKLRFFWKWKLRSSKSEGPYRYSSIYWPYSVLSTRTVYRYSSTVLYEYSTLRTRSGTVTRTRVYTASNTVSSKIIWLLLTIFVVLFFWKFMVFGTNSCFWDKYYLMREYPLKRVGFRFWGVQFSFLKNRRFSARYILSTLFVVGRNILFTYIFYLDDLQKCCCRSCQSLCHFVLCRFVLRSRYKCRILGRS